MNPFLEKIYYHSPDIIQNLAVTAFDIAKYKKRLGGSYKEYKEYHKSLYVMPLEEHLRVQGQRLVEFLAHVYAHSMYYRQLWEGISFRDVRTTDDLRSLPIVTKEDLRKNIDQVITLPKSKGCAGNTGGTTGKSLTVYYTWDDMQERFAVLDSFRERFGWKLGEKTAWFSGKSLLNKRDEANKRFWKTDYRYNIRYYSTFHITPENIPNYLKDLNSFQPQYLSGFPSNIFELANFAKINKFTVEFSPAAIFATAETLIPEQVEIIQEQFNSKVLNQYASSEGAPFAIECEHGKMHFLPATGVLEVVDERGEPAQFGEVLVTSFTTRGTPLVRYKIGDMMEFSYDVSCPCGANTPVLTKLEGRVNDYLYSRERGKINLGNVSNCVKYASGVVKFQALQNSLDEVVVLLVVDNSIFGNRDEEAIKKEFTDRLGENIAITFKYVDQISNEISGKYQIVKNNITHLIN